MYIVIRLFLSASAVLFTGGSIAAPETYKAYCGGNRQPHIFGSFDTMAKADEACAAHMKETRHRNCVGGATGD